MSAMSEDDLNFWQKFQNSLNEKGGSALPHDLFHAELAAAAGAKPIRYEEFYYLLSCYPYLDLHHPDGFDPNHTPQIIKVEGSWDILDFGDRIVTGPGRFLLGGSRDEESSTGEPVRPKGTLVEQMIKMADELIFLARKKGWPEVVVRSGFYGMIRAAWVAADIQGYKMTGFEPSESDSVVNVWVRQILTEKQKGMQQALTTPELKSS
jgi:hypothetical protein